MDLPADLLALARNQFGVMSRVQLVQSGVSRAQIRWRLGRAWRLLLPGVVLLEPGLPTLSQRYVAALLYAGPESGLSGPTALRLHGWPSAEPSLRVHVLVPPTHRSRDVAWLTIRRSCFTDERVVERGPVRFSCLPRAVVDAAALAPDESGCRALLIEAVQRRLVRLDDVSHWIDVRRPNGKVRLRRALAEAAAGAWSLPEADLARLLSESSTLPAAWLNPELHESDGGRLTTPDLWFDDVAMAVMVHSRKYHAGLLDWGARSNKTQTFRRPGSSWSGWRLEPSRATRPECSDASRPPTSALAGPADAPTWSPHHGSCLRAGCSFLGRSSMCRPWWARERPPARAWRTGDLDLLTGGGRARGRARRRIRSSARVPTPLSRASPTRRCSTRRTVSNDAVLNVVYPPQNPVPTTSRSSSGTACASVSPVTRPRTNDPVTLTTTVPTGNEDDTRVRTSPSSTNRATAPRPPARATQPMITWTSLDAVPSPPRSRTTSPGTPRRPCPPRTQTPPTHTRPGGAGRCRPRACCTS